MPARLDDLVKLPGVGRKTANVVLGNAFGIPGITVDTHFGRLARRFRWTEETDPVKAEHAVGALFEKRDWTMLSHHLIWHGRRVCHSQKPACGACPVAKLVPVVRRGPDRPRGRCQAGQDRGSRMRKAVSAALVAAVLLLAGLFQRRPGSRPAPRSTSTPRSCAELKAEAGIEDCAPGSGDPVAGGLPGRDAALPGRRPGRRPVRPCRAR